MAHVSDVRLGFEVGTGREVRIPVRNLAIAGQTQEAGKTTALEALIARSGLRAVTFVTKRGEGSFTHARRIRPYFKDAGDWQFVASILEASRGEKLKWERAAIITVSKGCSTLAQVHANIRKALEKGSRFQKEYICLDAYLEVVVPTIGRIEWAPGLDIRDGVNAIDLTDVPDEMQHLVIASSISWVLNREQHTVVVCPEAWKFIPQNRGTPVKLAAEAYVRQGSGLKNYLWLDSQDIGGVDKQILRSVPVWVLGVQREANEIKRTLENIPEGISKPSKADIATLALGQFIACWGKHAVPTYVQPAWLDDDQARAVAITGKHPVVAPASPVQKEIVVTEAEAHELRTENLRLRRENDDLAQRIQALESLQRGLKSATELRGAEASTPSASPASVSAPETFEQTYQAFKARLIADMPALLRVLTNAPELEVAVARRTVEANGQSLKGRIALLLKQGFFSEVRSNNAVVKELGRTGKQVHPSNSLRELRDLLADGFLTDEGTGYRAVDGMQVRVIEV